MTKTKPRVLIIDDDVNTIRLICNILTDLAELYIATKGDKALAIAREKNPHLILLDAEMPGMDGFEVCTALKSYPETAASAVLFVTAHSNIEYETRALELGAVDFISKPISPPILRARVQTHLTVKYQADALRNINLRLEDRVRERTAELKAANQKSQDLDAITRAIITEAPIGILVYDDTGQCIIANHASAKIVGCDLKDVISQNYHKLRSWKDNGLYQAALEATTDQRMVHHHGQVVTSYGRSLCLNDYFIPISMSGVHHLLVLVEDVTVKYLEENALREAKENAEAASVAKSQFLATMSHELRTPLNAIIGFGDMVRAREADEQSQRFLDIMLDAARKLLDLIQGILDFSRIESGKVSTVLSDFDLGEILMEALTLFRPEISRKGLAISTSIDSGLSDSVRGDRRLLCQVLINLIGNAVKFTEKGGIEISVKPVERVANDAPILIAFAVTDTGIGIKPENIDRIFDIFEREDNSFTAQFGGTGLGLAIAKQLVNLLGGGIRVSSVPGVGSCFTLTVPFEPASGPVIKEGPTAPVPSGDVRLNRTILVVEDDEHNSELLAHLLTGGGYRVEKAYDGAEALRKLKTSAVDLVLMDMRMPVMDGGTAVKLVRSGAVPGCSTDIPMIGVTAYAMPGDRERFLALGMNDYIAKPLDRGVLLATVQRILGNDQAGV